MTERTRLLLVEDNPVSRKRLLSYLDAEVYEVQTAESLTTALELVDWFAPALILLDLNLPDGSGLTLAKKLKDRIDVGIIMITSLGQQADVLEGLRLGADHYLTKPFNPDELNLKLDRLRQRVSLVRVHHPAGTSRYRFADWILDENKETLVSKDSTPCALTSLEFKVLQILVQHAGTVLSRDRILVLSGRADEEVMNRSVDITITRLRRKIEADPTNPNIIKTIRGTGYLLETDVEVV